MNRVTRSQFVSAISNLPFRVRAIRDHAGTVAYYHPLDTDLRHLVALREITDTVTIYHLDPQLTRML
jgi:hypothetical protein